MSSPIFISSPRAADRLNAFFEARTLAVVGASDRAGNVGGAVVRALREGGWYGKIVAVNPKLNATMAGVLLVHSVVELERAPDVAVIATPGAQVLNVVEELASLGTRRVAILSSGFSETAEGRQDEGKLLVQAEKWGLTILGPNCEGFADFSRGMIATFAPNLSEALPGPVSIVSQSGGLCAMIARRLATRGLGIDKLVSTGNECDLLAIDAIEAVAASPATTVVAAYIEQLRNPRSAVERLTQVAAAKPVVVLKAGRTDAGRRAAMSHTGAIAGPRKVLMSMLEQAGAVLARSTSELVDMVCGLAAMNDARVSGNRMALLSQSGGAAVEAADLCCENGLAVPIFTQSTQEELRRSIPSYGAVSNPVDFTAAVLARPDLLVRCVSVAADDPHVDMIVLSLTSLPDFGILAELAGELRGSSKPVFLSWLGSPIPPATLAGFAAGFNNAHISVFDSLDGAVQAAAMLARVARSRSGSEFTGSDELDVVRLANGVR